MASYHLRVKNDTQPSGTKVSALAEQKYRQNVTPTTFYARTENPMRTISIAKERRAKKQTVFLKAVSCLNGRKGRHKNFLARQLVTRVKEIAGIKKSNCLCPTN